MSEKIPLLGRLAHDLRGPLSPVLIAAHMLKSGQVEAQQQQELLELIERQTRRMAAMIDEVGDWARVNESQMLGRSEPSEVVLLLDFASAGTLDFRIEPAIGDEIASATVLGDQSRLSQMLRALLEYAISCGAAPPEVSLRIHGGMLEIGIAYADAASDVGSAERLFEEPLAQPSDEGLGLKLLIADAIAKAHDGSLQAEQVAPGRMRMRCLLPLATP